MGDLDHGVTRVVLQHPYKVGYKVARSVVMVGVGVMVVAVAVAVAIHLL